MNSMDQERHVLSKKQPVRHANVLAIVQHGIAANRLTQKGRHFERFRVWAWKKPKRQAEVPSDLKLSSREGGCYTHDPHPLGHLQRGFRNKHLFVAHKCPPTLNIPEPINSHPNCTPTENVALPHVYQSPESCTSVRRFRARKLAGKCTSSFPASPQNVGRPHHCGPQRRRLDRKWGASPHSRDLTGASWSNGC